MIKFNLNFIYKITLFLTLLISAGSCNVPYWYKPYGYSVFKNIPKNPHQTPGFTLGWIHGCTSGMGTQFGGAFYQTFYTWVRDVDIASSNPNYQAVRNRYRKELAKVNWNSIADIKKNFDDYNQIFWKAHIFCRHTVLGTLQNAGFNPSLPGEERFSFSKHSIGGIWSISGSTDTRIGTGQW